MKKFLAGFLAIICLSGWQAAYAESNISVRKSTEKKEPSAKSKTDASEDDKM